MRTPDPSLIALLDRALLPGEKNQERIEAFVVAVNQWCDRQNIATYLLNMVYGRDRILLTNSGEVASRLIVDCGGNPLQLGQSVNSLVVNVMFPTVRALFQREEMGRGIRTANDGNLLHHLAEAGSMHSIELVATGWENDMAHPAWFIQPQNNGKTALHVLWERAIKGEDNPKLWSTTLGFIRQGSPLNHADNEGRTVCSLFLRAQQEDLPVFRDLVSDTYQGDAKIRSMAHFLAHSLDLHTPIPETEGRGGRL